MMIRRIFGFVIVMAVMLSPMAASVGLAAAPAAGSQVPLNSLGVTHFTPAPAGVEDLQGVPPAQALGQRRLGMEYEIPRGAALAKSGALAASQAQASDALRLPVAVPSPVRDHVGRDITGWNGISHLDQRLANNGNQFSVEPPDQALCAGSGFVLEGVNDAMAVYDTSGGMVMGVTDLNTFFNYPPAILRSANPVVFGPELTDPRCLFDVWASRWYFSVLTLDVDPATGALTGTTHVDLAVSQSSDPTGAWNLYSLDTTGGDGSLPGHPGCPCLGDQPLIGFNRDTFVISTNEFSIAGTDFNGAQVYAIPRQPILSGEPTFAIHFDQLTLPGGPGTPAGSLAPAYSLEPANPTNRLAYAAGNGGTLYFLSALDYGNVGDNRIALWALTGTRSLQGEHPALDLNYALLNSETYSMPPAVTQKPGPIPLGDALGSPMNQLSSNDDRMNQASFDGLSIVSSLGTTVKVAGQMHAGAAYFQVLPKTGEDQLSGRVVRQGYLAVKGNDVLYPAVVSADTVNLLMTFTLSGPDYYPSAAYARVGFIPYAPITIVGPGAEPADGFTGYAAFGGNGIERWGDYSAAVVDHGNVWMATEYIPGGPRTAYANWGTFVFKVPGFERP